MRALLSLGIVLSFSSVARADIAKAKHYLARGQLHEASVELSDATPKPEAELLRSQIEHRQGKYKSAETRFLPLLKNPTYRVQASVQLSRLLRDVGRAREAQNLLNKTNILNAPGLVHRHELALVYLHIGELEKADAIFEDIIDRYEEGKIDLSSPNDLFFLAEATRYLGMIEDSNQAYQDATDRDPLFHAANLEWGTLFLEKHDTNNAGQSFAAILKNDPSHPDALAGLAQSSLEENYNVAAAEKYIAKALRENPQHAKSLLLKASIAIDKNQWQVAQKHLGTIFSFNPNHLQARSLMATIYWLRDQKTKYEDQKSIVFKTNPRFADFYHIVARSAEREHRYQAAISFENRVIEIDPKHADAMQALANGYLRFGQEEEGLKWLKKAYEHDKYNVKTVNTLDLFENHIPRDYAFEETEHFRIRYHKDEQKLLHRYIGPFLENAYKDMAERYGFEPKAKTTIELYKEPEHYSVRTIGIPNLGALAICFGRVITAMSPTSGNNNWGMVLWHELAHVFAIQLSHYRVPRWYTEGLSEYETLRASPTWRRENDSDLYQALMDNNIPSVVSLNDAFISSDMQSVVIAYHLSSVVMEFFIENHGFDAAIKGLKLFGQGQETNEVIPAVTGLSIKDFDLAFKSYLDKRLIPYAGTLHLPHPARLAIGDLEKKNKKTPNNEKLLGQLALANFYKGDAKRAVAFAESSLTKNKKNHHALYVMAEVALQARKPSEAKKYYEQLIEARGDSFDVRLRLASIAKHENQMDEAIAHLCAAKALDPERSAPYQSLAEIYAAQNKTSKQLLELETFSMLEQTDFGVYQTLVNEYKKLGDIEKSILYAELALKLNPQSPPLLMALGQNYLDQQQFDQALFTFESAQAILPPMRRPALADIGRAKAFVGLKKPKLALSAAQKATQFEPENLEALKLVKTLSP